MKKSGVDNQTNLRFAFGKNWKRYLRGVGESELEGAKRSLEVALAGLDLPRASFLDIGSGSGLFSRAAHALGFGRITSFDYDADSIDATRLLRQHSGASDEVWRVVKGSVLDREFMQKLGQHDLVYSWGVLHHTGNMWQALENAANAVKPCGTLFIALYNDQGWISGYWYRVKRLYVVSPSFVRFLMLIIFWSYFGVGLFVADLVRLRNPLRRHTGDARGMKFFTDVIDWVGGYPFEVAAPAQVISFLAERGFEPVWQHDVGRRHGCNEFVLRRRPTE